MPNRMTRRRALTLVGAGLATGTAGLASGQLSDSVRVNVGYESNSALRAARSVAATVHYEFAFDVVTVTLPQSLAEELAGRDDVRYVEADAEYETTGAWGVERVGAPDAHAAEETGAGAEIAVVDTGIDRLHPDLRPNLGDGVTFLSGVPIETGTEDGADDNGHGTHCAGTAAATLDSSVTGVAPEATVHAVKSLNAAGVGLTSDIAAGIEWAAERDHDVINLSLGGGETDALREACEFALDSGSLPIAAAGNSGPCTDCVDAPASYEATLAVSATTRSDALASFSSTGPEVDIAAPGNDIESTHLAGSYSSLSGTSMAAPHVAGAAALLATNGFSATETRDRLLDTAEDIGLDANEQGSGLLDVPAALGL